MSSNQLVCVAAVDVVVLRLFRNSEEHCNNVPYYVATLKILSSCRVHGKFLSIFPYD